MTNIQTSPVAPMAPKPHRVALDNPHGTNWTAVSTGIVRDGGAIFVTVTFQCDEGWRCDYGYLAEGQMVQYVSYLPATFQPRGWSLWAN